MRKSITSVLAILFTILILTACNKAEAEDAKIIKIGATAGPYSDQLKEGIIPILEKDGYKVEITEFNDYIQPNNALNENSIDANLFQNRNYLTNFNENQNMDLVADFAVPTAPMALYSDEHTSIDDIKEGAKITIPNDPTNLARALLMAEGYGWLTVDKDVDPLIVSENDIIDNPYNLKITPLEAAQTPRSLESVDFAFINGNFALAADLKLTEAVDVEKTPEDFLIYMTIRSDDKGAPFIEALRKAYESDEFLEYTNSNAEGYVKPPYQVEKES